MLFDITVFGSAKDGFVITNENICVRNSFEQPFAIAIKDVSKLDVAPDKIWCYILQFCCQLLFFISGLDTSANKKPNNIAAVIPALAAFTPPVNIPKKPTLFISSITPLAKV